MKLEEVLLFYMGEKDLKTLKTETTDNRWEYFSEKLTYPYEYFNILDDYQKPVDNLRKEDFFGELENKCPEEIERTKRITKLFKIKN